MKILYNMYLLLLTFTKTTVMRFKSLLLFIVLVQFLGVSAFGKTLEDKVPSKTEADRTDSIQTRSAQPQAPAALAGKSVKPSEDREDLPASPMAFHSRKSIFYSNAEMYVAKNKKKDSTGSEIQDASIYIEGTAKFDNAATIFQEGETALSGDFVSLKDNANKATVGRVVPLFTLTDSQDGVVRFMGKWNVQHIVRENLAGEPLYNNPLDNKIKVGDGSLNGAEFVMRFPTIKIDKDSLTTVADYVKAIRDGRKVGQNTLAHYQPEKMGFVSVGTNVAMQVNKLDMTGGNRFSVDAISYGLEKEAAGEANISPVDYYRVHTAYVDINNIASVGDDAGHSEVNMQLYDASSKARIAATNEYKVKLADQTDKQATYLRGFTSPFNTLRADYMFYHVLTRPSASSITNWRGPIWDPRTNIETGAGYFMGMDVSDAYFDDINKRWHTGMANASDLRARGGYNFSRVVQRMNDYANSVKDASSPRFSLYTFDKSDATNDAIGNANLKRVYENQRFNVNEVRVKVYGPNSAEGAANGYGLNFLGNPFMTPIDMSGLLAKYDGTQYLTNNLSEAALKEAYTPRFHADNVQAVHYVTEAAIKSAIDNSKLLLRSKYWIVHSALIANTIVGGLPMYAYNVKYDDIVAVSQGATVPTGIFNKQLEPMQMFLVQAATSGDFVFTQAMKTMYKESFPIQFYNQNEQVPVPQSRAAASPRGLETESANEDVRPSDWLVVEAITGKEGNTSVDRTAVRFFDKATQAIDKLHDSEKGIAAPSKNNDGKQEEVIVESMSNFLFTRASSGEKLLSNGVGYNTKDVPLQYYGSGEKQEVTFAISGVEGFDRVQGVKLVDRWVNGDGTEYVKDITDTDFVYHFETTGQETLDGENRFFLRFGEDDDVNPILKDDPITCYYSGSTLYIGGLNSKDMGSIVQIFDLQGRLMGNTTINNHPTMEYPKALGQGTFIVNISGERNFKTKFVNLQNY